MKEKSDINVGAPDIVYKIFVLVLATMVFGSCAFGFALAGGSDLRIFSDGDTTRQVKIFSIEW